MVLSVSAFAGYAQDFLNTGIAGKHLAPTVGTNVRREFACFPVKLLFGGTIMDQLAHVISDHDQFINTGTSAIALVVALLATHRTIHGTGLVADTHQRTLAVSGLMGALARRAQQTHQALCQYTEKTG